MRNRRRPLLSWGVGDLPRSNEPVMSDAATSPDLSSAVLAIVKRQPLEAVLRRLADIARTLTDADHAAVGAYDEELKLEHFETAGISDDERAMFPHPPTGEGLIGLFAHDSATVNIADAPSHESASGAPDGHPPMGPFLGMPVVYGDRTLGAFYVTRGPGSPSFSDDEQDQLESLAPYAAIAIRNAEAMELEQRRAEGVAALDRHAVRDAIARDLHDDVIQAIYAVGLGLRTGRAGDGEAKDQAIDRASAELQAVIADLRAYIHRLEADPNALEPDTMLEERLYELISHGGSELAWQLDIALGDRQLEPQLGRQIYLIAREMISNVVRHANAKTASLSLLSEGETLVIAVHDNGRGFDRSAVPDSAVGLRSIEQRVADLDGSALIESSPGDGTAITATLPWPEDPGHADA